MSAEVTARQLEYFSRFQSAIGINLEVYGVLQRALDGMSSKHSRVPSRWEDHVHAVRAMVGASG